MTLSAIGRRSRSEDLDLPDISGEGEVTDLIWADRCTSVQRRITEQIKCDLNSCAEKNLAPIDRRDVLSVLIENSEGTESKFGLDGVECQVQLIGNRIIVHVGVSYAKRSLIARSIEQNPR